MFSSVGKMHLSIIFEVRLSDQSLLTTIFLKLGECPKCRWVSPLGSVHVINGEIILIALAQFIFIFNVMSFYSLKVITYNLKVITQRNELTCIDSSHGETVSYKPEVYFLTSGQKFKFLHPNIFCLNNKLDLLT